MTEGEHLCRVSPRNLKRLHLAVCAENIMAEYTDLSYVQVQDDYILRYQEQFI